MYVVFITGGLASGKGAVCDILAAYGAEVMDADTIAKELQNEKHLQARILRAFGEDVLSSDGTLDRRLLAERAFASRSAAQKLNEICWPAVNEYLAAALAMDHRTSSTNKKLVIVQIPLLSEASEFLELADEVISVEAAEDVRLARAIARGMSPADAKKRLALQASDEQRRIIADTIFDNNGSLDELRQQVQAWYRQYRHSDRPE